MIRDFLDHLLLELRAQHYEDQSCLHGLENDLGLSESIEGVERSPVLVEQFAKYHERYETALIPATAIDTRDATDEEVDIVTVVVLKANIQRRDDQIGHMEALQKLFDEALLCAKVPFGVDLGKREIQPTNSFSVREVIDTYRHTPDFDEMVDKYGDHEFASEEVIGQLKAAEVIVAITGAGRCILFGRHRVALAAKGQSQGEMVLALTVDNPDELQFLVASIAKYKGRHDYDGNYYDEF